MLTISSDTRKGLAGVIVDETAITQVGQNVPLLFRGYEIQDLVAHCTFSEVAYLILHGDLPTAAQLQGFRRKKRSRRAISPYLESVLRQFPATASPVDRLRTAVSHLSMEDPEANNNDPELCRERAIGLLARIPTLVATDYRLRKGLEPIAPDPKLGFAANFFNMCFGQVPEKPVLRHFETTLILYADLGFAPSTFTSRVVASTLSDMYSAVTAAIGSLKGTLHGGATAAVMEMLLEIEEPERTQAWIDNALDNKRRIIGFGHRVFKRGDPRVRIVYGALEDLARRRDGQRWLAIQETLVETMRRRKGLHPNVDFFAGPAYYLMDFDIDLFTPIFAMARATGWTAHVMEQLAANKLIRPIDVYIGPPLRAVNK